MYTHIYIYTSIHIYTCIHVRIHIYIGVCAGDRGGGEWAARQHGQPG